MRYGINNMLVVYLFGGNYEGVRGRSLAPFILKLMYQKLIVGR